MKNQSTFDLYLETALRHIYNAEKKISDQLTTLAEKASNRKLEQAFRDHHDETVGQIERLEEIFHLLEIDPKSNKIQGIPGLANQGREIIKSLLDLNITDRSAGIGGILSEGKEYLRHFGNTDCNDLALIGSAFQVEMHEKSYYEFVIKIAEEFNLTDVVNLMKETLQEEEEMAERLIQMTPEVTPLSSSRHEKKYEAKH